MEEKELILLAKEYIDLTDASRETEQFREREKDWLSVAEAMGIADGTPGELHRYNHRIQEILLTVYKNKISPAAFEAAQERYKHMDVMTFLNLKHS